MFNNFEPLPYKVVEKKGNAVLMDQKGSTTLRLASHMKRFLLPDPATEVHEGDEAADMPNGRQLDTTALTPPTNVDNCKHPTLPPFKTHSCYAPSSMDESLYVLLCLNSKTSSANLSGWPHPNYLFVGLDIGY